MSTSTKRNEKIRVCLPWERHLECLRNSRGGRSCGGICDSRLRHLLVPAEIRHQTLQARVLIVQHGNSCAYCQPTVAGLPYVDSGLAPHALARTSCATGFDLPERSDALRLRMPALPHLSPQSEWELKVGPVRIQGCRSVQSDLCRSIPTKSKRLRSPREGAVSERRAQPLNASQQ